MLRYPEIVLLTFLAYCFGRVTWIGWHTADIALVSYPHIILLLAVFAGLVFRLVRVTGSGLLPLTVALGLTLLSLKQRWAIVGVIGMMLWIAVQGFRKFFGTFELRAFLRTSAIITARELRKFAPLLALACIYPLIPAIIHGSALSDRDGILHSIDVALFLGHDPLAALERIISTPLSEWLAFCYTGYAFIVMVVVAESYARGNAREFERLIFELTLALGIGYIGYSLVPARGPLFSQKFSVSLEFYQMAGYKDLLVDQLRIDRDVFPSLHTAITLLLMTACWSAARPLFWLLSPVMISIPVACVYLRYHYVTDVLAGMALAAMVWWLGSRLYPVPGYEQTKEIKA